MNTLLQTMSQTLQTSVLNTLERVTAFLPNLLSAAVIILLGWLLAAVASRVALQALHTLRVDRFAERNGMSSTLKEIGFAGTLTSLLSGTLYWIILLLAVLPAVEALRLVYLTIFVAKVLSYLPTVVAAAAILVVGLSLARFLSNSLARAAQNANLEYARALGILCRYFLSLIIVVITLAQLGVQTAILTVILAVILISVGLATALALGYGSRAVVANILAGSFVRDHFQEGRTIEVQGVRGTIIAVNSVGTTLQSDSGLVTVPNTVLMENIVE